MGYPVTIMDVAKAAGVSKSTVSRALTDHPRISGATKERVRAVAGRLGYQSDPAMRILCSYRNARRGRGKIKEYPIAILTDFAEPTPGDYHAWLIERIGKAARDLGYLITTIDALEYSNPGALARVMESRGIRGLICLPIFQERLAREFPWERFCIVLSGQPKFRPPCHMVREDRYGRVVRTVGRVWEMGYRRPALAMVSHSRRSRYFDMMSGGYFSEVARLTGSPLLISPWQITLDQGPEDVRAWVEEARPDVIIGENLGVYNRLIRAGFRVPGDLAFVSLFRHTSFPDVAGFDMGTDALGRAMVNQLDQLIRHNVIGYPSTPSTTLVKMEFVDGASLPPRRAKRDVGKARRAGRAAGRGAASDRGGGVGGRAASGRRDGG